MKTMKYMKAIVFTTILLTALCLLTGCEGLFGQQATHEVRYELNGGTLVSGYLLQTVRSGEEPQEPVVEREGYQFTGWVSAGDSDKGSSVYLAQWEKADIPLYEVRYELNGGTLSDGQLLQHVPDGGDATEPTATRDGYTFVKWDNASTDIHENTVIVAVWQRVYEIRFDAVGGKVEDGELVQSVAEGETPVAPVLHSDDMTFLGWVPEIQNAHADTTYEAQWERKVPDPTDLYTQVIPSVVEVTTLDEDGEALSIGTGFFIDEKGTLLTCFHCVEGAHTVCVRTQDGLTRNVRGVTDYDASLDLALLAVDADKTPYLRMSESETQIGETVYALGSSQGLTGTFSTGIVSSARDIEGVHHLQITAPISGGNSGGPLFNQYGDVVGINRMTMLDGQNLNFAVDALEVSRLKCDGSAYCSMEDFWKATKPEPEPDVTGEGFLDVCDSLECEPNDSYLLSDHLLNGDLMGGTVSDEDDVDFYYFTVSSACTVHFQVTPQYRSDAQKLLCGVATLDDDELSLVDALQVTNISGGNTVRDLEIELPGAGTYFLIVFFDDDYTFHEVSYVARVNW